jgi:hypothetical protein
MNLYSDQWNSGTNDPYINLRGLLNPNTMKMNHTMSFMTGVSSSGSGFYRSVYTNHLFFNLHPKVELNLDLNFVNYGTTQWNDTFSIKANDDNNSRLVPEFSLQYRPTDNTSIKIEFRSMGSYQQNSYRWWE